MTEAINNSICRPDEKHYCTTCCGKRNNGYPCGLLGTLPDGTQGCIGHDGKQTEEGLTQQVFCITLECIPSKRLKEVRQVTKYMPAGKFDMNEVLAKIGR